MVNCSRSGNRCHDCSRDEPCASRPGITSPPRDWIDLTDPKYFGEIAVCDPTKSGSIAKSFESIIQEQIYLEWARLARETGRPKAELEKQGVLFMDFTQLAKGYAAIAKTNPAIAGWRVYSVQGGMPSGTFLAISTFPSYAAWEANDKLINAAFAERFRREWGDDPVIGVALEDLDVFVAQPVDEVIDEAGKDATRYFFFSFSPRSQFFAMVSPPS